MVEKEIELIIKPSIEALGYQLWGCEYLSQGRYSMLRIYIDKQDGIGIDDCQKVSLQVSALLDVNDPIQGHYNLEVSSPGIPRPLFHWEQYQQCLGQDVQIKLSSPVDEKRKFTGVIEAVDEHYLTLALGSSQQRFAFSNIIKANLINE